jgi:hypothetical protein
VASSGEPLPPLCVRLPPFYPRQQAAAADPPLTYIYTPAQRSTLLFLPSRVITWLRRGQHRLAGVFDKLIN